jgi:hypothetical protein
MIPLVFIGVFFLATGYFQVKFPRYLLPLYPMLFIFAAALFASMFRAPSARLGTVTGDSTLVESEKLVRSKPLLAPVDVSGTAAYGDPTPVERKPEEPILAAQSAPESDPPSEP